VPPTREAPPYQGARNPGSTSLLEVRNLDVDPIAILEYCRAWTLLGKVMRVDELVVDDDIAGCHRGLFCCEKVLWPMRKQKLLGMLEKICPLFDPSECAEILVMVIAKQLRLTVLVYHIEDLIYSLYEQIEQQDVVAEVVVEIIAWPVVLEPFLRDSHKELIEVFTDAVVSLKAVADQSVVHLAGI
jgi:hypothetical protein